jgi:tetratricopeptide (TPR) repeat protein
MDIKEAIQLAFEQYQAGNLQQAEKICREILEVDQTSIDGLNILGWILQKEGQIDEAITCFQKVLQFNPDSVITYYSIAVAYNEKGCLNEAIRCYEKALNLDPANVYAYNNLGNLYRQKGQLSQAISCFQKALQIDPTLSNTYYNFGIIYRDKRQVNEAMECFQKALQIDPNHVETYTAFGYLFYEKGQIDEAIIYYQKALALNPINANANNILGIMYRDKGQVNEAIAYFQKALQIAPDFSEAYNNLGLALRDKGQLDDAIRYYKKALELNPNFDNAYNNIGVALQNKGDYDEALSCYQKVLRINPSHSMAHFNISFVLLLSGDFKKGWEEYEWRWGNSIFISQLHNFHKPIWKGTSLKGKNLLIYAEQGIGDEIMFASCLPDVATEANLCIVECNERLVPLFARSFPRIKTIKQIQKGDAYPPDVLLTDMKIPIGSLPQRLRPSISSFPQRKGYLIPDAQKAEIWRQRFEMLGKGLKVGISWRGGSDSFTKITRSIPLKHWKILRSLPGVYFVNLQYGDYSVELKDIQKKFGVNIHDWEDADPLMDLDNFAAQISALDVVISVDNATVHMAGALGAPVWVLLPFACDWRWMRDFGDTPWYPTMRLFRQKSLGEWDGVFEKVSFDLKKCITTGVTTNVEAQYSYKRVLR